MDKITYKAHGSDTIITAYVFKKWDTCVEVIWATHIDGYLAGEAYTPKWLVPNEIILSTEPTTLAKAA